MAIDVGPACINRATESGTPYTEINKDNPANATGTIDYFCAWFVSSDGANVNIGVATDNGGDNLTIAVNGCATGLASAAGKKEWNAPGDFTAFNVTLGDYAALYHPATVTLERSIEGAGSWYDSDDNVPGTADYTAIADRAFSIFATGTEAGGAVAPTSVLYGPLFGPLGGPI